ncbi:DUF1173 family protein [Actinomadura violacea]|uniref:DUF1173 family protein n=1 Tax=Actinomadura violacea TaxID=2819934 RepID=A0ABS3S7H6_9ACTN|nr:DUF1173 family protein [Actinomadura violacea]MBO2464956.1 DUF1173 family protein [Actinomadura violacea]
MSRPPQPQHPLPGRAAAGPRPDGALPTTPTGAPTGADREPAAPLTEQDGTAGQVRLADHLVPLAAVRHDPGRFTRLLARARAETGHAECLCRTPALKLVIRSRSGRYHLARWPGEGDQHTPECPFHQAAANLSGRGGYTAGALTETTDGTTIRLATPLQLTGTRAAPALTTPARTTSGTARTMSLLGLLHWLWEQAQLNLWHPTWRRSWSTCHTRLTHQAADCTVNGHDLTTRLYVVPPYRPDNADANTTLFTTFTDQLSRIGRHQQRGLILGEIKDITPTKYGSRLTLRHHRGALFASTPLLDKTRRSYRAALSTTTLSTPHATAATSTTAAGSTQPRRIGLFLVERTPNNYLAVADMAAMLTNYRWIPADSSHEVAMADHLITAGRSFTKPLRYDGADAVFPDFVLTDTPAPVYVEVYGVLGRADYDERKRAKQEHYRDAGTAVIEWNVTDPLPEVKLRSAAPRRPPTR